MEYIRNPFTEKRLKNMSLSMNGKNSGKNNGMYGKHHSKKSRRKITLAGLGRHHSEETKRKIGSANAISLKGKHLSKKTKQKLRKIAKKQWENPKFKFIHSKKWIGENNPMKRPEVVFKIIKAMKNIWKDPKYRARQSERMFGKNNPMKRPEVRQKVREARLNQITPAFNSNACKIIDEYGKKHGYRFQHALNGGEHRFIGYSVDGYDAKKNVVIEYYENRHRRNWRKDLVRQRRIVKALNCEFIVIKEWGINK